MWAGRGLRVVALSLLAAATATAQDVPDRRGPVLVLRQDVLFDRSAFGQASSARIDAAGNALVTENREIEAALEVEERDLTERRATLPAAEFRALSDAFNAKVEGIRTAQDAKSRAIARTREEDRQRFVQAAVPVLAGIMRDEGAAVILDQQTIVLSFDRVDVTEEAISRIDAAIGDGSDLPPGDATGTPPPDAPVPDTVPAAP